MLEVMRVRTAARFRSVALFLLGCTALSACAVPLGVAPTATRDAIASSTATARPSAPVVAGPAAVPIDAARAKAHLDHLADPALRGRFTGSPGYNDAARYMADQLAAAGVEPYGDDGTFFQRYSQPLVDLAATPTLVRLGAQPRTFTHRVEFTESVNGASAGGSAEGPLVFAGSGTRSAALDDLTRVPIAGKIVMLIHARSGAIADLARLGAAGVVVVSDRMIKFSYIPRFQPQTLPTLVASQATADALLAGSGRAIGELRAGVEEQLRAIQSGGTPAPSLAFEAAAPVRMSLPLTPVRQVEAINVVGIIRGSDPDLAKRAILIGGHLDGVGTDPDGTVFEAANDNASGPAVTIELARSLVQRRAELRHSVIVVAFAGEEQGLWGSEHYANQESKVPGRSESLLAYINLDVVGCCGRTIAASDESPSLFEKAERAAEAEGFEITDTSGSSDHASFARRRVEVLHLLWASTGAIHTVRDDRGSVTAESLGAIGRVAGRMVLELARGTAP